MIEHNSWEYFRGEELLKIEDWLIEVVHDKNLQPFHATANFILDRFDEMEIQRGSDYPADEWIKSISLAWGLAENIENYVIELELLSDAHVQPDWPTIYDYRDEGLILNHN